MRIKRVRAIVASVARLPAGIKKVQLPSGIIRYEFRTDEKAPDGSRRHRRRRFPTVAEASAAQNEAAVAKSKGEPLSGSDSATGELRVEDAVSAWMEGRRVSASTLAAYTAALAPVVARYGSRQVTSVTKADAEKLVQELRLGENGKVWARTSINPMLARWKAVWRDLLAQRHIAVDPVSLVLPLRKKDDPSAPEGMLDLSDRLTEDEIGRLMLTHDPTPPPAATVRSAPYLAALRAPLVALALLGLRRGEVAGLRWSNVDFSQDGTEAVLVVAERTRVPLAGGTVEHSGGKTASARRALPLPSDTVELLKAVWQRQQAEWTLAGDAWQGSADLHLLTLPDGSAVSPRTLNDWWRMSLRYAQVPHRRLHAARHTAASQLIAKGASPAVVAAWLGHADGGELVLRTYSHVHSADLLGAAALLTKGGVSEPSVTPDDPRLADWNDGSNASL